MTGRYVRIGFAVFLLLAAASPSFAARRSSLSGNLLIQDADDMFFFPQLVTMNKRMVTFDFGTNAALGSGGMVWGGESFTIGAFTHRSDYLLSLDDAFFTRGDIDNINRAGQIGVGVGPDALNWIDLLFGWQAGDMPIGVRFSVGRNNNDPADPPGLTIQNDVTAFNVILGTTLARWNADASLEFSYASATSEDASRKLETSPWYVGVGLRHTAKEESDAVSLGWLGLFSYRSGSIDSTATGGTTASTDNSGLNVVLGAGPVYKPNDRTNIAMYGTFAYRTEKSEGGGLTETHTNVVIPGWNVAAEMEAASWLQFRAGLRSEFAFFDDHHEATGTDTHDKQNTLDFAWTSGVGVHFRNFNIDGYLDPSVLTTGTDLLGNSNQVFGMVTATCHF